MMLFQISTEMLSSLLARTTKTWMLSFQATGSLAFFSTFWCFTYVLGTILGSQFKIENSAY